MSQQSQQANQLHILAGPQEGATTDLEAGSYLLGAADHCDLALRGEGIADAHALLVVDAGGNTLEALEEGVSIAGRAIGPHEPHALGSEDVVGLGEVYLGIGHADSEFTLPTGEESAHVETDSTDIETPAVAPEQPQADAATGSQAGTRLTASLGLLRPPFSPRVTRALVGGLAVILALVMLVESVPGLHHLVSSAQASAEGSEREDALHRTNTLLHNFAFDQVEATLAPGGGVILTGHTSTDIRLGLLNDAVKTLPFPVANQVWSEQGIQAKLHDTLHRVGAGDLKVVYLGDGDFDISGYYGGAATAEELVSILRSDVPRLGKVEGDLHTQQDAVALLRDMVRDQGLSRQLRIKATGSRVEVGGALDPDEAAEWRDIARAFELKVGRYPKILDLVSATEVTVAEVHAAQTPVEPVTVARVAKPAPRKFPNLVITGVIVPIRDGGRYLALLESGATLSPGDVLDEQYVVEKIEFNSVTLRAGDQVHSYYVGDHHHG